MQTTPPEVQAAFPVKFHALIRRHSPANSPSGLRHAPAFAGNVTFLFGNYANVSSNPLSPSAYPVLDIHLIKALKIFLEFIKYRFQAISTKVEVHLLV